MDVTLSILLVQIFLTDSICVPFSDFLRSYATYRHFVTRVSLSPEHHTHTPIQQFTVSNLMLVIIQTPSRESVCAVCVAGSTHHIPIIFVGPV